MRMPPPLRSGSRTSSWVLSGGGKAPASGGSVRRAGASLAAVTGRQSGAVDAAPFTIRRMSLQRDRSSRQPATFDPGLREHSANRVEQRLVARPQPFEREMGALRLARRGQPVPELPAERLAIALQAVARQHGRPRPAGHAPGSPRRSAAPAGTPAPPAGRRGRARAGPLAAARTRHARQRDLRPRRARARRRRGAHGRDGRGRC